MSNICAIWMNCYSYWAFFATLFQDNCLNGYKMSALSNEILATMFGLLTWGTRAVLCLSFLLPTSLWVLEEELIKIKNWKTCGLKVVLRSLGLGCPNPWCCWSGSVTVNFAPAVLWRMIHTGVALSSVSGKLMQSAQWPWETKLNMPAKMSIP